MLRSVGIKYSPDGRITRTAYVYNQVLVNRHILGQIEIDVEYKQRAR